MQSPLLAARPPAGTALYAHWQGAQLSLQKLCTLHCLCRRDRTPPQSRFFHARRTSRAPPESSFAVSLSPDKVKEFRSLYFCDFSFFHSSL